MGWLVPDPTSAVPKGPCLPYPQLYILDGVYEIDHSFSCMHIEANLCKVLSIAPFRFGIQDHEYVPSSESLYLGLQDPLMKTIVLIYWLGILSFIRTTPSTSLGIRTTIFQFASLHKTSCMISSPLKRFLCSATSPHARTQERSFFRIIGQCVVELTCHRFSKVVVIIKPESVISRISFPTRPLHRLLQALKHRVPVKCYLKRNLPKRNQIEI